MYRAPLISSVSTRTPNAFMRTSICHCFCSASGIGNCSRRFKIARSVTTSCLLYSLKSSHFSFACHGWFQVRFPLVFVGLQGTQKYRISAFPAASFCLSWGRPMAFPVASSPAVYPQYRPWAMVQRHCSSGVWYPARFRQYHSNAALYACFVTSGSASIRTACSGISSPWARSTTSTGFSSSWKANRRMRKSGDWAYLYSPAFPMSTLLLVSISMLRCFMVSSCQYGGYPHTVLLIRHPCDGIDPAALGSPR